MADQNTKQFLDYEGLKNVVSNTKKMLAEKASKKHNHTISEIDGLNIALESAGKVKTVNNSQPDASGNITIDINCAAEDSQVEGLFTPIIEDTTEPDNSESGYENIVINDIIPATTKLYNIGSEEKRFKSIYADEIHVSQNYAGSSSAGGAATKAISDSDGKQINTTYAKLKIDIPESIDPVVVHRRYRGKNLGSVLTDAQSAEIKAGTFDDIFVGDYWEINNIKWRIMDIDYYYNCGDSTCTTHHLVIVPDEALYNQRINASSATTGAYIGSEMYKSGLNAAKTTIANAFSGHLLTIRHLFSNSVNGNVVASFEWVDATVWLMNEVAVYGTYCHTLMFNSDAGTNKWPFDKYSTDNTQYAGFAQNPRLIHTRYAYWLRNIAAASDFVFVTDYGDSGSYGAYGAHGVRPAFCIS